MLFQWINFRANKLCIQKPLILKLQFFLIHTLPLFCRDSHFTLVADSTWLDFLDKAIDHNMAKLTAILQEQGETNTWC